MGDYAAVQHGNERNLGSELGFRMLEKNSTAERILAVFAECPTCDALVLSYASSRSGPAMQGNEDHWALTCDRCGAAFDIPGDEVLLRSIPASWLLSKPDVSN